MSGLSQKRLSAIYEAVHEPLMRLRIAVSGDTALSPEARKHLDNLLYRAQRDATEGAMKAAKGEKP